MVKTITIYKGCIRVLYVDNVTLKDGVFIPSAKDEIFQKDCRFYLDKARHYHSIEHGSILPGEGEAKEFMMSSFQREEDYLRDFFQNPNPTEDEIRVMRQYIAYCTHCNYIQEKDLLLDREVEMKRFKKYLKEKGVN